MLLSEQETRKCVETCELTAVDCMPSMSCKRFMIPSSVADSSMERMATVVYIDSRKSLLLLCSASTCVKKDLCKRFTIQGFSFNTLQIFEKLGWIKILTKIDRHKSSFAPVLHIYLSGSFLS